MAMAPPLFPRRWLAAGAAGALALAGVFSVSLANALISVKLIGAAASLPFGAAMAARAMDAGALTPDLSRRALRESPLVQSAITRIARDSAPPRADALLAIAARLGWRDAETQRRLYTMAVRHGDCPSALARASALMRQGVGFAQLAPAMAHATTVPTCRPALIAMLRRGEPWAEAWLRHSSTMIDPAMLGPIIAITHARREIWATLVARQLANGRPLSAHALWQQAREPGARPNALEWPTIQAQLYPTAFDWTLAPDMTVSDGQLWPAPAGMGVATRRLMLAPGAYLLSTAAPADAAQGWRWNLSCGPEPTPTPAEPLLRRQVITVPLGCRAPWLTLMGGDGPMAVLTLRPLPSAR